MQPRSPTVSQHNASRHAESIASVLTSEFPTTLWLYKTGCMGKGRNHISKTYWSRDDIETVCECCLSPKGKTGYLFYSDILGFSKNTVPISNRKLVKALTQSEIWGFLPYRAHQHWRFSSRFQQSPGCYAVGGGALRHFSMCFGDGFFPSSPPKK